MTARSLVPAVVLAALVMTTIGCGAHRVAPVDARGTAGLTPQVEDSDAGLVGIAPGFSPKGFDTILVEPFTVAAGEIKDADDITLAKDMSAYLQTQLLVKLKAAGIFARVVDATGAKPAAGERALRLSGDIARLTEGSQALRYFVGFGAGAAKAQIEARLVEQPGNEVRIVTADRRAAAMGIFGGDGRQFITQSMDQMADGLVKLLKHLAAGGQPGKR